MKFKKNHTIFCIKSSFFVFKFILIFLLSISTKTFTEDAQKVIKDFKPTAKQTKIAENMVNLMYVQSMRQMAESMPKNELDEFKERLDLQAKEDERLYNKFFFEIWYQKNKSVLTKQEQNKYEQAWEKGLLIGMAEDENSGMVFSIIQFPNGERCIIPSGGIYADDTLMHIYDELKVEADLTKVFEKVVEDYVGNTEAFLYNMLFMRVLLRSMKEWLIKKAIF